MRVSVCVYVHMCVFKYVCIRVAKRVFLSSITNEQKKCLDYYLAKLYTNQPWFVQSRIQTKT